MQCNIDARGKAVRLISGGIVAIGGASALILYLTGVLPQTAVLVVAIAALAAGGLGVFEGWAGWCIIRAMGFKTPA